MVDPIIRISIPEIRQHPWFNIHIPRYLAVPPLDISAQKVITFSVKCSKR